MHVLPVLFLVCKAKTVKLVIVHKVSSLMVSVSTIIYHFNGLGLDRSLGQKITKCVWFIFSLSSELSGVKFHVVLKQFNMDSLIILGG